MNLNNKAVIYSRFSTYSDVLGNDILVYVYAKDENLANNQIQKIKLFCNHNNLNCLATYIDTFSKNRFESKLNLKKLLIENSNINVLVYDIDRLSRNIMDIFEIKKLCVKKNINFFNITTDKFIFDDSFYEFEKIIQKNINKGSDDNLQRYIDVLYVEPNKLPVKKTIKNTLEEKQKLVGGLIEYTYLEDCNDVAIVCNEEGKLLGLPPNRDIGHDIVVGNFFLVGDDPELGEDRSLTKGQIEKYSKYFGKETIDKTNKKYNETLKDSLDNYYY